MEGGRRYAMLHGATTDRDVQVAAFQSGDLPLFLVSLKAGGTGLNLTAADTVIIYDPWWKPTIVNSILRILSAKGVDILLCAPTGRAAKRLREATGFEAKTIHRLLEVDPRTGGFRRDAENPLDCSLLVVDETSIEDVMLMRALVAAVRL